jgi:hypothetical protein
MRQHPNHSSHLVGDFIAGNKRELRWEVLRFHHWASAGFYVLLVLQALLALLTLFLSGGFVVIFLDFFPSGLYIIIWLIVSFSIVLNMRRLTYKVFTLMIINALMFAGFLVVSQWSDPVAHGLALKSDYRTEFIAGQLIPASIEVIVSLSYLGLIRLSSLSGKLSRP